MYTENDRIITGKSIRKWSAVLILVTLVFLAAVAAGLILRSMVLTVAASVLGVWAFLFVFFMFLNPMLKYGKFLKNLEAGLKRDAEGAVVSISPDTEEQDGAVVHTMQLLVAEGDERRLYLNAAKKEFFPAEGEHILAHCCGRHVIAIEK